MEDLSNLLGRIKQSLDRDVLYREAVTRSVKRLLSFDLRLEDISIKGRSLRIRTTPAKKNEIRLHEPAVLEAVRAETGLHIDNLSY